MPTEKLRDELQECGLPSALEVMGDRWSFMLMREALFPTPSGKARFQAHRIPAKSRELEPRKLKLMTIRSEGQFNSVVYDEEDIYRGQERRDVLLMNRDDIRRMGLKVDDKVHIRSECGQMRYILVREFDIRAGNAAMYYPESNVLVPHAVDPLSKTPAFKSVLVTVVKEDAA